MTRKLKYGIFALLLGWSCTEIAAQPRLPEVDPKVKEDPMFQLQKLNQFYRYLNGTYVDTLHNDQLVEKAIQAMLLQLDPHSTYLTQEEMKESEEMFTEGSFSGIGIEFNILNDTVIVVNVIAGGPSEQVGLLPNDRIVSADGKSIVGTKLLDVPKILRGPKGTRIDIGVVRHGEPDTLDFSIVRDDIPIYTVDAAYKVDSTTGYIRINRFANNTFKEFLEAYQKLQPIDALILDLRSNGGGLLGQAIELSNFFLPKSNLIVSMEGMRIPHDEARAAQNGEFLKGKVIVLTNETSASASEIVSGALQDWDRALIIGRRTFGKGLVQQQIPLMDGSAVRLTVARYHTPTGRVIQRPYHNGDLKGYEEDFFKRFESLEDSVSVDSTLMFKTLRSGRTVYGGGGITPDILVQYDTTEYSNYLTSMVRKGLLNEYAVSYMDRNRDKLAKQYPTFETYNRDFQVTDKMLSELTELATQRDIEFNQTEFDRSARLIRTQLKALIAQKLWGINEYYIIMNAEFDETFDKALDVLKNWDQYGDPDGTIHP